MKENWKEKIAHRKDTLLEGIEIFKDYMVLNERAQANTLMPLLKQSYFRSLGDSDGFGVRVGRRLD